MFITDLCRRPGRVPVRTRAGMGLAPCPKLRDSVFFPMVERGGGEDARLTMPPAGGRAFLTDNPPFSENDLVHLPFYL